MLAILTTTAHLSIPFLLALPVMEHATGAPKGLVLAAPHEGYDMYSGDIARRVSKTLGWGRVVAKDYRDTKLKRWIDVNRPTQRTWSLTGKKGKEGVTTKGKATFAEYTRRLRAAAQVGANQPLALLVEFHGHNRRVPVGRDKVRLDVIECATRGFSAAELTTLHTRYDQLAAQRWPVGPRIQLRFDLLHPTYTYRGTTVKFYYQASGAKKAGSLQASVTTRALHFEMPQNARSTKTQRAAFGALLSKLLAPLKKHGVTASPSRNGATGTLRRDGTPND